MKPIDVTNDSYAENNENFNERDSKFKIDDNVRISKYKNILDKGYTPNWSEEVFVISKIKNTEEITGRFMKKNCKKLIKRNLE